MISYMVNKKISFFLPYFFSAIISTIPKYHFSDILKAKHYKEIIDDQITIEQKIGIDLIEQQYFQKEGWTVAKDNTIVELSKVINKYEVRLMSKIKSPIVKKKEKKGQLEQKIEEKQQTLNNINEVIVLVTKISSRKTMTVNAFLTNNFHISNITFAQSVAEAKSSRLDIFGSNRYTGPSVDSYNQDLFTSIHAFLRLKLRIQNQQLLKALLTYCQKSQRILYIEWLKNFSNFL